LNLPLSSWDDSNSLLTSPLGSELFLISNTRFLNGQSSYSRVLCNEGDHLDLLRDAHESFPYDDVAHKCAKIITRFFILIFKRKVIAAIVLQKIFRGFSTRKKNSNILKRREIILNRISYLIKKHNIVIKKNFIYFLSAMNKKKNLKDYLEETKEFPLPITNQLKLVSE
jgi:hypothetical protein